MARIDPGRRPVAPARRRLLSLALAALGLAVAAPAATAQAPEPVEIHPRFASFIPPDVLQVWEEGEAGGNAVKRTYVVTPEVAAQLEKWLGAEILAREGYLRLAVVGEGASLVVVRAEPIAPDQARRRFPIRAPAARLAPTPTELTIERHLAVLRGCEPGEFLDCDGQVYVFEQLLPNGFIAVSRDGEDRTTNLPLAGFQEVRRLGRTRPRTGLGPAERDVHITDNVELRLPDGSAVYGVVAFVDARTITVLTPEGEQQTFERTAGLRIARIAADDPRLRPAVREVEPVDPGPGPGPEPPPAVSRVREVHAPWRLDADANRYLLEGTVHHEEDGKLLLRAQLSVTATSRPHTYRQKRYTGRMVPPDKEAELLASFDGRIPDDGAADFGVPVHPIYVEGGGLVVIKREALPDAQTIVLAAIFPRHPKPYALSTDLLNPEAEVQVTYRDQDFVPFTDPRAAEALMTAYVDARGPHGDLERQEALAGMVASRDPRLLSFLFYSHYLGDGDRKAIEGAVRGFGEPAESWLLDLLEQRGWEKGVEVAGPGEVARKVPKNPEQARASALRLLSVLGSERAFQHALDALKTSKDADVARAARAVFIDRPQPPDAWLVPRLTADSVEVRDLLLDLDAKWNGTLVRIYERLGIDDPGFDAEVTGLPPDKAGPAYVRRMARWFEEDPTRRVAQSPQLVQAASARDRIRRVMAELPLLTRAASEGVAARAAQKPPPTVDHRHWRAEQLRRALILDPANADAERRLGELLREVLGEVARGPQLRVGPGDDWAPLRALKPGDVFQRARGAPQVPGWVAVSSRGGVSYLSASVARPGSQRVLALQAAVPPEERLGLLRQALHLDVEQRAAHEAEVVRLLADLGATAARQGEWGVALDRFREAAARQPSLYLAMSLVTAYLHANTWIPAAALAVIFVFLTAVFARRTPLPFGAGGPPGPAGPPSGAASESPKG